MSNLFFFINVWRKSVFDIYIHWIWYCFDNYFTYFAPSDELDKNISVIETDTATSGLRWIFHIHSEFSRLAMSNNAIMIISSQM